MSLLADNEVQQIFNSPWMSLPGLFFYLAIPLTPALSPSRERAVEGSLTASTRGDRLLDIRQHGGPAGMAGDLFANC